MKLSIVTISFNAEQCIERTIRSVLNQTLPVYEYIMIDGASKDRTYEIICSYEEEFLKRGIRFVHISEPDKGISDAFNKGIARATGDLVGLINADDELLPETSRILSERYAKIQADVYYGNSFWVDTDRGVEYVTKPKSHDYAKLLYHMILIHPSTFITKQKYDELGVYNTTYRYCMDKELLYRFYKSGARFCHIDEALTKVKSGGVSDKQTLNVYKEGSRMALGYGEPPAKVWLVEWKKRVRSFAVKTLKQTKLFLPLKKLLSKG